MNYKLLLFTGFTFLTYTDSLNKLNLDVACKNYMSFKKRYRYLSMTYIIVYWKCLLFFF
jgi:hypothetical protein